MKKLWLHSVRTYLRIGMFFYFKKIKVYNLDYIPKNKPVLILSNHQNALLDALLIATKCNRFAHYLTRAAVFKKSLISKILMSLQMLPVYRIRDGWSNLTNNNEIFETCTELLHRKELVVIFPEGSHNLARRVRPLSKGFTRIVFDTLEKYPDTDLKLVPLGLNFVNATNYPDSTSMYFGKPIDAKSYVRDNKNEGIVELKKDMHSAISKLTTHIPVEKYDRTLKKLDSINVDFLDPKGVNDCIANNLVKCNTKPKASIKGLRSFLKVLLIINILPAYLIWKFVAQPKVKEAEFLSTFRFAIALTLVPFWIIAVSVTIALLFGLQCAVIYFVSSLLLALLSVKV